MGAEAKEHATDPALATGAQQIGRVAAERLPAGRGEGMDLPAIQREVARLQKLQAAVTVQMTERQHGRSLAGGENVQAGGGMAQEFVQVAACRACAQLLQVVEDQRKARILAFQAFDDFCPQPRLGGRCRWALPRGKADGLVQVHEQVAWLVVAALTAKPGPGGCEAGGVPCEQGALAIAERRAQQGQ